MSFDPCRRPQWTMSSRFGISPLVLACIVILSVFGTPLFAQTSTGDERIGEKVDALLAQMTLEEKIGQLTQIAGGLLPGAFNKDQM